MSNELLAQAFACSDAKQQAAFLNEVGAVFRSWVKKNHLGANMQHYWIAKELNGDGRDWVHELSETIVSAERSALSELQTAAAARDLLKWEVESLEKRKLAALEALGGP